MPAVVLLALALLLSGCADRERRNPLDPGARDPAGGQTRPLAAVAGDGRVDLSWDYSRYTDIVGYRVYRRTDPGEETFTATATLGPEASSYVDRQVDNGATYAYRLALEVEGEEERLLEPVEWATPGPEVAWVADRLSGLVWKVATDARSAHFGRGRFASIEGLALDHGTGAVWVSDRYFAGLYRIDAEGKVTQHRGELGEPGPLAADPSGTPVWVTDGQTSQVKWFRAADGGDSLNLEAVDASFSSIGGLAPQAGGCWVSDPAEGRVLFYHPRGERFERPGLDRPGPLAAGADSTVWVLASSGEVLLRLGRGPQVVSVSLGAARGVALDVDLATGEVWVLTADGAAVFDALGAPRRQVSGLEQASDLALESGGSTVWVAGQEYLWKLTLSGEPLARLGGFAGLLRVVVDPGAGA
ncbi:MAG: hypothetical protein AB1505_21760 [Candidatus Latescibacterota bacterium]